MEDFMAPAAARRVVFGLQSVRSAMAAGIESKANLYLLDEGLLDDCGGCQHVGHKAAALGEGGQLGCWDCFN
ncbi:hypothetical protein EYF80_019779 [Liparis tanakae]|uniref:Uncharacterized protein n=1 Tax=Liparis tanakae TaxID=230148 RepID=A0A4Z2HVN2_9TELE|nr:hypothetical protein EYF80_019779 [Liparis tanakae]